MSSMKGIAPLAIIVIVGALAVEGVIVTDLVGRTDNIVRAARETEIIRLINEMEFAKRYLSQALTYAYYQASYDLAKNGGFLAEQNVNSYNCIAFWREYEKASVPDYENNLKLQIIDYFKKYGTALKSEVKLPVYSNVDFDHEKEIIAVSANNELRLETETVKLTDTSEFKQKVDFSPFLLFDIGKEIFDEITSATQFNTYGDAAAKIRFIENKYVALYGEQNIDVSISSENIGSSNENYALRALVTVQTKNKYPIFNTEKITGEYPIKLSYYVIFGKEIVSYSEPCI